MSRSEQRVTVVHGNQSSNGTQWACVANSVSFSLYSFVVDTFFGSWAA